MPRKTKAIERGSSWGGINMCGKSMMVKMMADSPLDHGEEHKSPIILVQMPTTVTAPSCWGQVLACGPEVPETLVKAQFVVFAPTNGFRVMSKLKEVGSIEYRIINSDVVAAFIQPAD